MFFTALKDGKDWGAGASGSPVVSGTKDWIVSQVPMKRFGQPEDIAAAVLYLTSSESAYVIGADLIIDGGMKTLR